MDSVESSVGSRSTSNSKDINTTGGTLARSLKRKKDEQCPDLREERLEESEGRQRQWQMGMDNNDMKIRQLLLLYLQYLNNEDEFWDLVACATGYICIYFLNHMHKELRMTSYLRGERRMNELLNGCEERCFNTFRMKQSTFCQLCVDLENKYGLRSSSRMSILEKVGLFVYLLGMGASNRDVEERFQRSSKTISRTFREVLNAMDGFSRDILVPKDPELKEIPPQIVNDARYMPHFKDCVGAIDGTHIAINVPEENQIHYIGKKGIPTTNVLAACDFGLLFTYVLTGWEGSVHDSCIFLDTISDSSLNFPKPPLGKYYLVDKDYPESEGYLTPYPKTRYHQLKFHDSNPKESQEVFNQAHASLRSCIEKAFGVLKSRWKILQKMPRYSLMDQNRIICSCFALHNYIRKNTVDDPGFRFIEENPKFIPPDVFQDVEVNSVQIPEEMETQEMATIRDNIASSLMAARCHS
ncbi:PREDICTED: putative nuclease HARBI1 [Ipomoea nil]|uniref:putative nuclease HARBI1 n=1 Tax=Ipomoea nil TaxID=35883 RepID=UPI000900FA85|nr:PREDICTED: putative nuclease HARBI1 [Ipomoea nil]